MRKIATACLLLLIVTVTRVALLDEQVVVEGPLKLFRFADPDGNVLELFSLA